MKSIILNNNYLEDYSDNNIEIKQNKITFKKDGNYQIEYKNSNNINLELDLSDNVEIKLFIYSENLEINSKHLYNLNKNSKLILYQFYNNKNVFEEKIINLNGENSTIYQGFSSISINNEEYHIIVNHNNKKVKSQIYNKCIGCNNSSIKFIINSILKKGNTECIMDQNTKILTLGDTDASIVPNMFIEEDSVEAKHGSVISGINNDDIFYLMTRGITNNEAVTLLIKGFIFSNLSVDIELRAKILNCISNLRR